MVQIIYRFVELFIVWGITCSIKKVFWRVAWVCVFGFCVNIRNVDKAVQGESYKIWNEWEPI